MNSPHHPRRPFCRLLFAGLVALLSLALAGCVGFSRHARHHEANSVVQFLYPDTAMPFVQPEIPTLRLPLRVGLAFVPPATPGGYRSASNFSEAQKTALLRQVAAQFKALPFVSAIEIVPTTYLRPGGGFDNLDQVRALLGVDVIALVAYDQAQNTADTAWSLAYWTIVGAYVVPAQKNDTHTLMEAVVYDIPSCSLLFRAPGTSAVTGHTTLVRTAEELRLDSAKGFETAATDMTASLQRELELFKVRAREEPHTVKIEHRPGYTGGGSLDAGFALLLVVLLGAAAVRALNRNNRP